jgi:hypothetical protein
MTRVKKTYLVVVDNGDGYFSIRKVSLTDKQAYKLCLDGHVHEVALLSEVLSEREIPTKGLLAYLKTAKRESGY